MYLFLRILFDFKGNCAQQMLFRRQSSYLPCEPCSWAVTQGYYWQMRCRFSASSATTIAFGTQPKCFNQCYCFLQVQQHYLWSQIYTGMAESCQQVHWCSTFGMLHLQYSLWHYSWRTFEVLLRNCWASWLSIQGFKDWSDVHLLQRKDSLWTEYDYYNMWQLNQVSCKDLCMWWLAANS